MKDTFTDFSGGINEQLPPVITPTVPGQGMYFCESAQNFELSERGIIKYPGLAERLSSAISGTPIITGIFEYTKTDDTKELVVCTNGKVFTVAAQTATQIYTGHTADQYYIADQFDDVLILCNGVDSALYYNGTTCTTISFTDPDSLLSGVVFEGVAVVGNRAFYWDGDNVYTPRPETYNNFENSFNSVDVFPVSPGSGGGITGIKGLTNGDAIIYKKKSIHRLSGNNPFGSGVDEFTLRDITRSHGCIAPRTLVDIDSDHYFLSEKGYVSLTAVQRYGDIDYRQPDYKIRESIQGINFLSAAIKNCCAAWHPIENRIYLCAPDSGQTQNNRLFIFDTITETCEKGKWLNTAVIGLFNQSIYTGDYNGMVYQFGSGNDFGGNQIEANWETKWIAHGGESLKRYKRLKLYVEAIGDTNLTVQWSIMRNGQTYTTTKTFSQNTGAQWDVAKWDEDNWGGLASIIFNQKNLGRGTAFKLKLINNSTSQQPKIRQIELEYESFGENS